MPEPPDEEDDDDDDLSGLTEEQRQHVLAQRSGQGLAGWGLSSLGSMVGSLVGRESRVKVVTGAELELSDEQRAELEQVPSTVTPSCLSQPLPRALLWPVLGCAVHGQRMRPPRVAPTNDDSTPAMMANDGGPAHPASLRSAR